MSYTRGLITQAWLAIEMASSQVKVQSSHEIKQKKPYLSQGAGSMFVRERKEKHNKNKRLSSIHQPQCSRLGKR